LRRYHAFPIGMDGRFLAVTDLHAEDDRSAIEIAGVLLKGGPFELWAGGKFVARVDNLPSPARSSTAEAPSPPDDEPPPAPRLPG